MPSGVRTPTIGDLRDRVRLESVVLTPDGHGGSVSTWALLATVAAAVWPVSGREAVMAEQATAVLSTVVWIHYRTGMSVTGRIRFGSRVLQIESIDDPTGLKAFLRILCSEVQS